LEADKGNKIDRPQVLSKNIGWTSWSRFKPYFLHLWMWFSTDYFYIQFYLYLFPIYILSNSPQIC